MDQLALLRRLDKVAGTFARVGLRPINQFGRRAFNHLLKDGITVEVDGITLAGAVEHRAYLDSARRGLQEPYMTRLVKVAIKPGMVVLDLGAFIGGYALMAARLVGPAGRVYAFEPDPLNYPFLVRNIRENQLADRVVPVFSAASDTAGTLKFYSLPGEPTQSSLYFDQDGVVSTVVQCVRVDDVLADDTIVDVVKMDVEGAELSALAGMPRVLALASQSLVMFVECNTLRQRAAGQSPRQLLAGLRELGFDASIIDEERCCLEPPGDNVDLIEHVNLLCRRGA